MPFLERFRKRNESLLTGEVKKLLPKIQDEIESAVMRTPDLFTDTRTTIIAAASITPEIAIETILNSSTRFQGGDLNLNTEQKLRLLLKDRIRKRIIRGGNDKETQAFEKFLHHTVLKMD